MMKRKPLLFALALFVFIGAGVWGVNWRLDHPPLSAADKEFRALVASADRVEVSQQGCQSPNCGEQWTIKYKPSNAAQSLELIEKLRFTDDRRIPFNAVAPGTVALDFTFQRKGADLIRYTLWETPHSFSLVHIIPSIVDSSYQLHPRFEKPLRRFLDQVAPQRIKP